MKRTSILGACLSAALLAACGGSSTQPFGLQTTLGPNASHRLRKNIQTEKVLYSFGIGDGAYPRGNLINVDGILYGTTELGGANGKGTVFAVLKNGTQFVLHSFKGGSDGNLPDAGLTNLQGTLYGTTAYGGSNRCEGAGCGTVYKITTSGTETVLYSFGGSDGAHPHAGLTNLDGTLVFYGTTHGGGTSDNGTVFGITTSGFEKVLYNFGGGSDGANPSADLTIVDSLMYGTTTGGGAHGNGTVFAVLKDGTEFVLHSFAGKPDGSSPYASLTNVDGTLYGTTLLGGEKGFGTVFSFGP